MIDFQVENVEQPDFQADLVCSWLGNVAEVYGKHIGNITYRFCSDEDILRYNRDFLGHDYYTDVITFDYTTGNRIEGDIVISLDTVATNAEQYGDAPADGMTRYQRELMRVIVHGVLHLCGINDKGPGERDVMEQAENNALRMFGDMKESKEEVG